MTDLSCVDYSEKAIVVRGNTKEYKEELKKLGGKFNANLKDGAGWIFPKKNEDKILFFIANGNIDKDCNHDKKENKDLLSTVENEFQKMSLQERLGFISKIVLMVEKGKESIKEPTRAAVKPVKEFVREPVKNITKPQSDSDECEDTDDSVDEYVKNYRKLF